MTPAISEAGRNGRAQSALTVAWRRRSSAPGPPFCPQIDSPGDEDFVVGVRLTEVERAEIQEPAVERSADRLVRHQRVTLIERRDVGNLDPQHEVVQGSSSVELARQLAPDAD